MSPELSNNDYVLAVIVLVTWAAFAYQTWRRRNDHH